MKITKMKKVMPMLHSPGHHQKGEVLQLGDDDRQREGAGDAADSAGDHGDGGGQQRRDAAIGLQPKVERHQHARQATIAEAIATTIR